MLKLQNDSIEDSEVDSRLGKKKKRNLANFVKLMPSQLQVFLLPANFKLDRITSQTH